MDMTFSPVQKDLYDNPRGYSRSGQYLGGSWSHHDPRTSNHIKLFPNDAILAINPEIFNESTKLSHKRA